MNVIRLIRFFIIITFVFGTNACLAQRSRNIYISKIKIDEAIISTDTLKEGKIVLNNDSKSIALTISKTSSYESSLSPICFYKMSGIDNIWNESQLPTNTITYYNLPSGEYLFTIKDSDQQTQSLAIVVESTILEKLSWAILLLSVIAISLTIYFIIRTITATNRKIFEQHIQALKQKQTEAENSKHEIEIQREDLLKTIGDLSEKLSATQIKLDQVSEQSENLSSELKEIVQKSHDLIFKLKLPEENFVYITAAAQEITGYTAEDFQKDPSLLRQMVCKSHREEYIDNYKQALVGIEPKLSEFKICTKDGEEKWVRQESNLILNDKQQVIGLVGVIRDINQQKSTEQKTLTDERKLEEALKLKTMFLTNLSQKAQAQENTINGFSKFLSSHINSTNAPSDNLDSLNSSSSYLLRMMDDIIDILKIESGQIEISKSQCYINAILEDLYNSFDKTRRNYGKNQVSIKLVTGMEEDNFSLLTDNFRFRQIMTNLLNNALRYSENGEISFGYKLSEEADESKITFFVHDTGKGLSSEDLRNVFDRYKSLYDGGLINNKDDNRSFTSELGLSIAKSLVELLGGKMWVESKEGMGTTFYFTLPVEHQKGLKKKDIASTIDYSQIDWSQKTLLLAEDEENNYKYVKAALRKTNIEIIYASDGEMAVNLFKENKSKIDIILMDIQMPKMNGYLATAQIKELSPKIPIIAQTAFAMAGGKIKCFEAGCDGYISKPYKAKDLIDVLNKYI